ncbi:hypothetical protein CSDA_01153, partial [Streptococcus dysgalactiae]
MEKNKQMKYYLRKSAFGLASVSAAFLLGSTVAAEDDKTEALNNVDQISSLSSAALAHISKADIDLGTKSRLIAEVDAATKEEGVEAVRNKIVTSVQAADQAEIPNKVKVAELFKAVNNELGQLRLGAGRKDFYHKFLLKIYDNGDTSFGKIAAMNNLLNEAKDEVTREYYEFATSRINRLNLTDEEKQAYLNGLEAAYKNADDRFGALYRTFEEAHTLSEERNLAKEKATNIEHATAGLVSFLEDEKPAEDTIKEIALDEAKVLADRELSKHGASHYYHVLVNKANTVEGVNQIVKDVVESIKANNIANATEGL